MKNNLFLIIKTNSYTGNYERELMAYVFGYDQDGERYASDELDVFEKEVGKKYGDEFLKYLNQFAFGNHDSEYCCYEIDSHPTNKKYNCDSIFVALNDELPENLYKIAKNRLKKFCDYYNKSNKNDVKILSIDYYSNKSEKTDDLAL